MTELENASPTGRLLEEISWEGNATRYRNGGRGKENVLTVEALTPLDYLPRQSFLGQILREAHGADQARIRVASEIEQAQLSMLPGDIYLGHSEVYLQPDATIVGPSSFVLVEAKRIRRSSFQENQLAREFVAVLQESRCRTPLLLLILGEQPPVPVKGFPGRSEISTAIIERLASVDARSELGITDNELANRIPETVAWTTWSEIRHVVVCSRERLEVADELAGTVTRLCDAIITAIDWHT